MTICIVSNGHGEDILASELAKQLALEHEVVALPLVGEGTAYDRAGIKKIHSQPLLPSGGFAYLGEIGRASLPDCLRSSKSKKQL